MTSNLVYVLPLFTINHDEVESAKGQQLQARVRAEDPEEWKEAQKYDRFLTLNSFICKYNGLVNYYRVTDDFPESDLLDLLWATLNSINTYTTPAGWGISKWWSTLINRSIYNKCKIPGWAAPSRTQKFQKIMLHDFCNLYQAGNTNYDKPLPDVAYALQGWLGIPFNSLDNLVQSTRGILGAQFEKEAYTTMLAIINGLEEVERRLPGYNGYIG